MLFNKFNTPIWQDIKDLVKASVNLIVYGLLAWALYLYCVDPHPTTKDYFSLGFVVFALGIERIAGVLKKMSISVTNAVTVEGDCNVIHAPNPTAKQVTN